MFKRIKLRIQDMKTIAKLISNAEKQANLMGEAEAGAEHFLLAAFELPDGVAKRVFKRLNTTPEAFKDAIKEQYNDALRAVGVSSALLDSEPELVTQDKIFRNSKPSGENLMKDLHALKSRDKDAPLLGIHVVEVIANMEYGVAARALQTIGIEKEPMLAAITEEHSEIEKKQ